VFTTYYSNVTHWIEILFYVYLSFNTLQIIIYSIDIKFKGNKGRFFKYVDTVQKIVSFANYAFIWSLIYFRFKFEV